MLKRTNKMSWKSRRRSVLITLVVELIAGPAVCCDFPAGLAFGNDAVASDAGDGSLAWNDGAVPAYWLGVLHGLGASSTYRNRA